MSPPAAKLPLQDAKRQVEFTGSQSGGHYQPVKRYTPRTLDQRPPDATPETNRVLSFPSQKQEKNALPSITGMNKMIAQTIQPAGKSARAATRLQGFPGNDMLDAIDASQLVSLQAFNVCKDPQREFRQKTQLAAHFMNPARIEAQGVVYFVQYTESGYTIQIHIYNPHERPFNDRCEVLDLAIEGIINRVN
jgi:hypothetical protein